MPDYILGIDIGTSACKCAVFGRNGEVIASRTEAYNVYYPKPGYAEQKPEEWWEAARKCVANLEIDPRDIKAVGVDGQSWSAIMLGKNGEVLFDNPIWIDSRASGICEEIKNSGIRNREFIFELSCNPISPNYTAPKIIWFKRNYPEVFGKTHKVLQSNSYIVYKLTGVLSQDLSQCYGLCFFDMRKKTWDRNTAEALGIDLKLMPDIYKCDDIVGRITKKAAKLTGLIEGTPVVAGGVDSATGTLGAGVIQDGETQEQGGQSGGMSVCLGEYNPHEKLILCAHVIPDKYLLQGGTVGGGASLKWLRENFFPDSSFKDMDNLAEKITPGSDGMVFLPYMSGERSPVWDPRAKGVFYGVDFAKTKAHFIRAVMESTAYSLLHNLETAEENDCATDILYSNGGAAGSDLWMQIKADVTNKPVAAVNSGDFATTLGAAILAGVAIGLYSDFSGAVKNTIKIRRHFEPVNENHEIYRKRYETYLEIYKNLKETMFKF